jgi:hypothetical protein
MGVDMARRLLYILPEDVMKKQAGRNRSNDSAFDREDEARRALDEHGDDAEQGEDMEKFDPRGGEDPGALELTEDPLERRQKRVTM